jgi:hypothetical protein
MGFEYGTLVGLGKAINEDRIRRESEVNEEKRRKDAEKRAQWDSILQMQEKLATDPNSDPEAQSSARQNWIAMLAGGRESFKPKDLKAMAEEPMKRAQARRAQEILGLRTQAQQLPNQMQAVAPNLPAGMGGSVMQYMGEQDSQQAEQEFDPSTASDNPMMTREEQFQRQLDEMKRTNEAIFDSKGPTIKGNASTGLWTTKRNEDGSWGYEMVAPPKSATGKRDHFADQVDDLAAAWTEMNGGMAPTPAEMAQIRLMARTEWETADDKLESKGGGNTKWLGPAQTRIIGGEPWLVRYKEDGTEVKVPLAGEREAGAGKKSTAEKYGIGPALNAITELEFAFAQFESLTLRNPWQKFAAWRQFQISARASTRLIGRALGEVGVFTNQDAREYEGSINPGLLAYVMFGSDFGKQRMAMTKRMLLGAERARQNGKPLYLADIFTASEIARLKGEMHKAMGDEKAQMYISSLMEDVDTHLKQKEIDMQMDPELVKGLRQLTGEAGDEDEEAAGATPTVGKPAGASVVPTRSGSQVTGSKPVEAPNSFVTPEMVKLLEELTGEPAAKKEEEKKKAPSPQSKGLPAPRGPAPEPEPHMTTTTPAPTPARATPEVSGRLVRTLEPETSGQASTPRSPQTSGQVTRIINEPAQWERPDGGLAHAATKRFDRIANHFGSTPKPKSNVPVRTVPERPARTAPPPPISRNYDEQFNYPPNVQYAATDSRELKDADPRLVKSFESIKKTFESRHPGYKLVVSQTARTRDTQGKLVKQGVTEADGVTKISRHNYYPALAMDVDIIDTRTGQLVSRMKDKKKMREIFELFGTAVTEAGLHWGGDWRTLYDPYHIQLAEPAPLTKIEDWEDMQESARQAAERRSKRNGSGNVSSGGGR